MMGAAQQFSDRTRARGWRRIEAPPALPGIDFEHGHICGACGLEFWHTDAESAATGHACPLCGSRVSTLITGQPRARRWQCAPLPPERASVGVTGADLAKIVLLPSWWPLVNPVQQVIALGDYMDEVAADVETLDQDIRRQDLVTLKEQSFQGPWTAFLNTSPPVGPPEFRMAGWRSFYAENRGFVARATDRDGLYRMTEAFERELVSYYDQAIAGGLKPIRARPVPGFVPASIPGLGPGTSDTIERVGQGLLTIGLLFGLGYVLSSVAKVRGQAA
jgi:DNA-directed RNA polymerase subunit RPC12/RpoP